MNTTNAPSNSRKTRAEHQRDHERHHGESKRPDLRDIDSLGVAAVEGGAPLRTRSRPPRRNDLRFDPGAVGVWHGSLHHRLPVRIFVESYVGTAAGCHNGRVLASFEVMTDALREKLVDAGRVLVSEDQGDYVAGHVTCACRAATDVF